MRDGRRQPRGGRFRRTLTRWRRVIGSRAAGRAVRRTALTVAVPLAVACGGGSSTATAVSSPPPPASGSATPAHAQPDDRRVDIAEVGLGAYMAIAVPVAIVRNDSSEMAATGVTVHLTVTLGAHHGQADTVVATIPPRTTAVVTARVAGIFRGGTAAATVTVGAWTPAPPGTGPVASAGALTCARCASGGSGSLAVTVTGAGHVSVGAACRDAAGRIIGGGSTLHVAGPAATPVTVPVILAAPAPGGCTASATPAGL